MSLQLVVYPQTWEGVYTWNTLVSNPEMITDQGWWYAGFSLHGSAFTTNTTSSTPILSALQASPPVQLWRGFRTTGGVYNSTSRPKIYNLNGHPYCRISSTAPSSVSGIYQNITGLTPGEIYNLEIKFKKTFPGTITIGTPGLYAWQVGGTMYHGIPSNQPSISFSLATTLTSTLPTNPAYTYTVSFTASQADHFISIGWSDSGDDIELWSVSCLQNTATQTIADVTDRQEIVDLYEHTPIPLTLSIDDFKKMAEKVQSYSKGFNVPATKHNNKIFSNLFDLTTSVEGKSHVFNPYRLSKAVLKEDGHTVFEGHLRLLNVKEEKGEMSYAVNLFSQAVSLKAVLGNKTFNDFQNGFQELEHSFTKVEVKKSWYGRLPIATVPAGYNGYLTTYTGARCTGGETETNVLKYPFCRYNGDISQNVGGGKNGYPVINHMTNAFRPWIRIKYLWDRILGEAGFSYQSDFIEGIGIYDGSNTYAGTTIPPQEVRHPDFKRLFMDFNWGKKKTPGTAADTAEIEYVQDNGSQVQLTGGGNTWVVFNFTENIDSLTDQGWVALDHEFVCPSDNLEYTIDFEIAVENVGGAAVYDVRVAYYDGSTWTDIWFQHWTPGGSDYLISQGQVVQIMDTGHKIRFEGMRISSVGQIYQGDTVNTENVTAKVSVSIDPVEMTSDSLLVKRGKTKQWDFIKDIMTMFNLMIIVDKEDHTKLKIEPYDSFFGENLKPTTNVDPVTRDWTDKVDSSKIEINPLKLKKDAKFTYKEDSKDYASGVYNTSTAFLDKYGDFSMTTDAGVAAGEAKLSLKVFSPTFCTPPFDSFHPQDLVIPQLTSIKETGEIDGLDNKPRILYDVSGDHAAQSSLPSLPGAKEYKIPAFHGSSSEWQDDYCQFSPVTGSATGTFPFSMTPASGRSFNWGYDFFVTPLGNTSRYLFNEYWLNYYDELNHSDTKVVKLAVWLTPLDMASLNFYDRIYVKNRLYKINKIEYKPEELSKVELILLP